MIRCWRLCENGINWFVHKSYIDLNLNLSVRCHSIELINVQQFVEKHLNYKTTRKFVFLCLCQTIWSMWVCCIFNAIHIAFSSYWTRIRLKRTEIFGSTTLARATRSTPILTERLKFIVKWFHSVNIYFFFSQIFFLLRALLRIWKLFVRFTRMRCNILSCKRIEMQEE